MTPTEALAYIADLQAHPARPVSRWMGRPVDELTREELLQVVEWCGREIQSLRSDRDRLLRGSDAIKYLMAG